MNMFYSLIPKIKRPIIWLCRIRNRCGYGVHSPFAFNLITQVIYENTPYYIYSTLKKEVAQKKNGEPEEWSRTSTKVNQLLFRLVNYIQPSVIVDLGQPVATSLYLQAGNLKAMCCLEQDDALSIVAIDFLYIHKQDAAQAVEADFQCFVSKMSFGGLCVVEGIHHSRAMKQCWKRLVNHECVGITFDLYDVGLLFFDKSKIKQDYKVNF